MLCLPVPAADCCKCGAQALMASQHAGCQRNFESVNGVLTKGAKPQRAASESGEESTSKK